MNDHLDAPLSGPLSELRDDGGAPLPLTPEGMLAQARGIKRRRQLTAGLAAGATAVVITAGAAIGLPLLLDRSVQLEPAAPFTSSSACAAVTTPAGQQDIPPDPDVPVPGTMLLNEARMAVDARLTPYETGLRGIKYDKATGVMTLELIPCQAAVAEMEQEARAALIEGGFDRKGVRFGGSRFIKRTPEEGAQLRAAVQAQLDRLRQDGVNTSLSRPNVDFDLWVTILDGDSERVRDALRQFGDSVHVLTPPAEPGEFAGDGRQVPKPPTGP